MLRRIITLIGTVCIAFVIAEEKTDKLDKIQKTLDNIVAKAGIQFDGEFKSEYLSSQLGGSLAKTNERKSETNEFTSVDFDIKARPNEMLSANVKFRMHQNWQNFFSDVANPIFTRWISIDGNVKNMIMFNVGDFRQKLTPLTLYTPEIEILNEPTIFARQREIAENELFIGDNERAIQGINFKMEAEVAPIFNEFHFNLIGSRLRNIETSIGNGNKVTPAIQASPQAKYFVAENLDLTFLKGINLGATDVFIFDQRNSFKESDTIARTLAQRTNIFSVRPGVDVDNLIDNEALTLSLNAELAFSSDDTTSFDSVGVDTAKKVIKDFHSKSIDGSAINVTLAAGYQFGDAFGVNLTGSYIMNDKYFRNELAQSPSFYGDRIMNNENNNTAAGNVGMYNTFDALYHSVFKFCPSEKTNRWDKAPFMKTSYWRSIQTQDELAKLASLGYFDDALQMVYPYGPATPNRAGVDLKLKVNALKEGVKADVVIVSLNQMKADSIKTTELPKVSYSQMGGGLKVDISKFVSGVKYPIELSGSFVASGKKSPAKDTLKTTQVKSNFVNAGLYYKFWKRTALLLGYQVINNSYYLADTVATEVKFGNWSVGAEWSISDGANLVASIGEMSRENEKVGNAYQTVADVSLRVKF